MRTKLELRKKIVSSWFRLLQTQISEEFMRIERKKSRGLKANIFKKTNWSKSKDPRDGGGTSIIIKNGSIFDSVGVNFSEVSGKFEKKFRSQILGAKKKSKLLGIRSFCGCSYEKSKNASFTLQYKIYCNVSKLVRWRDGCHSLYD